MSSPRDRIEITFFSSNHEQLRREVGVIRIVLGLWLLIAFGLPLLIWLFGLSDPSGNGASWLTRDHTLFDFPLHYWLIAQGATLGFVGLCRLYGLLRDRRFPDSVHRWKDGA